MIDSWDVRLDALRGSPGARKARIDEVEVDLVDPTTEYIDDNTEVKEPTAEDIEDEAQIEAEIEIPEDDVRLWEAVRVVLRGQPGFVVRTPDRIHACSGVCTHLGCIVRWNRSRRVYFCPCHGARFAADGRVLGGPAPAPLPRFKVDTSYGKIIVELA